MITAQHRQQMSSSRITTCLSTEKCRIHLNKRVFGLWVEITKVIRIAWWLAYFVFSHLTFQDACLSAWDILLTCLAKTHQHSKKSSGLDNRVSIIFMSYKMKTIICPQAMHPVSTNVSENYLCNFYSVRKECSQPLRLVFYSEIALGGKKKIDLHFCLEVL